MDRTAMDVRMGIHRQKYGYGPPANLITTTFANDDRWETVESSLTCAVSVINLPFFITKDCEMQLFRKDGAGNAWRVKNVMGGGSETVLCCGPHPHVNARHAHHSSQRNYDFMSVFAHACQSDRFPPFCFMCVTLSHAWVGWVGWVGGVARGGVSGG